jgi:hypothetical protein
MRKIKNWESFNEDFNDKVVDDIAFGLSKYLKDEKEIIIYSDKSSIVDLHSTITVTIGQNGKNTKISDLISNLSDIEQYQNYDYFCINMNEFDDYDSIIDQISNDVERNDRYKKQGLPDNLTKYDNFMLLLFTDKEKLIKFRTLANSKNVNLNVISV